MARHRKIPVRRFPRGALVSHEDWKAFRHHSWHIARGYVRRWTGGGFLAMAYEVILRMGLCVPHGMEIDHINRIPWDNRRENLRIVTHEENQANRICRS